MSYEDQLIREAIGEHQERPFNPFGEETLEAEDRDVTNETGDQQGETISGAMILLHSEAKRLGLNNWPTFGKDWR